MPVTLKTGVMKYRKPDGSYSVMDALMQEPTNDQIAAIESAGQEQIDAVEQKGEDVLASLPEEYTELEADVSDLKSATNETFGYTEISKSFVAGSSYYNIDVSESIEKGDVIIIAGFVPVEEGAIVTLYGNNNGSYTNLGVIEDDEYREIIVTNDYPAFRFTFYRPNTTGTPPVKLLYNTKTKSGVIRDTITNKSDIDALTGAFVTPQMYGAKADGINDDTAAFQSAIDSGTRVCVPSGVYLITSPLEIKTDSVFMDGCNSFYWGSGGTNNAIIKAGAVMDAVILIDDGITCLNIQNINIDGDNKAVCGILHEENGTEYTHDNVIKNVRVEQCTSTGIKLQRVYKSIFENVRVKGCSYGFYLEGKYTGSAYINSTTLTLIQCYGDACNTSFYFNRVSYSTLINCASDHTNYFCYEFSVCSNISIINCGCEAASRVPIIFFGVSNCIKIDGFSVFSLEENLDDNRSGIIVVSNGVNNLIVSGINISTTTQRDYKIDNNGDNTIIVLDNSVMPQDCKSTSGITFVVS